MSGITQALAGRVIENVTRNEVSIVIRCSDGFELQIGWEDPKTKQPVAGVPAIVRQGIVRNVQSMRAEVGFDLRNVRQEVRRQIGR
jgi:hypothetical protein